MMASSLLGSLGKHNKFWEDLGCMMLYGLHYNIDRTACLNLVVWQSDCIWPVVRSQLPNSQVIVDTWVTGKHTLCCTRD